MVQRSSVLLSACSLVVSLCAGCTPGSLGIHVPPTGADSVNQEDLRRAYWALERGDNPLQWWLKRGAQFHLEPLGSTCHLYKGQSNGMASVYAQQTPMQLAVMASLAKALDRTEPTWSWQFCLVESTMADYDVPFETVVDLTDDFRTSPSFVEVNFENLAHDVQEIVRTHMQ